MKLHKYSSAVCHPCKQLTSILSQIDLTLYGIEIVEHDLGTKERSELLRLGIRSVPTLILFDHTGNELKRKVGLMSQQQLEDWLKS